uniref:Uncharacterized protein n=1 Tax=viral metagenome TaxID=1070528 RepID=A0A6H2A323_9ZZZZ
MECKTCEKFDKEVELCDATPDELSDIDCLLRNILWALLLEDSEGESWKFGN